MTTWAAAILLAAAGGSAGQAVPVVRPAASLPAAVADAYREDAARLAARYAALRQPEAGERSPRLDPALVDSLFNALAHLYAAKHPARDAVVDTYGIHTHGNPPLYEVMVGAAPEAAWAAALQRGEVPTGQPALDRIMAEFALRPQEAGVLRSSKPLDIEALAARLARVPGARYAEPNRVIGDGSDITAIPAAGGWRLTFKLGWGDCPAGCTSGHEWTFVVSPDGSVSFAGEAGSPPPPHGRKKGAG